MSYFHGGTHSAKIADFLDFSANTSPLGVHPAAVKALSTLAKGPDCLAAYPDPDSSELKKLLAQYWNFHGAVLCGSGAADLIQLIATVIGKRANAQGQAFNLIIEPAFSEYENALKLVCHEEKILHLTLAAENDFSWTDEDFGRLEKILSGGVPLLFMATPANPSGNSIPEKDLFRIAEECEKTGTVLVIDACFAQFSKKAEESIRTLLSQSDKFPHLIVLNAFTKIYGLAGLRLGYCLCASEKTYNILVESMRPWAISTGAQRTGAAVIKEELKGSDWQERTIKIVEKEKGRLEEFLKSKNIRFIQSETNYLLFRLNDSMQEKALSYAKNHETGVKQLKERSYSKKQTLFKIHDNMVDPPSAPLCLALAKNNIAIRGCADFFGLDSSWYRTAIKNKEENEKLIEKLDEILSYEN